MGSFKNLMMTKVPITFLTATLPVRLELTLKTVLALPDEHRVIRASTDRPEHQYFIFRTQKDLLLQHAITFILLASSLLLRDERRGIIFVRSKEMGENIRTVFPQFDFIHANIHDDRVRSQMIKKWKEGHSGGWIIGTTSLIQGIDYHNVHVVVFVASPFGLIDFVQGAGRAGRNGMPSRIIVLHAGKPFGPTNTDREDLSCKKEMCRWLTERICRRTVVSECMDGVRRTCRDIPNAVPCDHCEPNHDLGELWTKVSQFDHDSQATNLELGLTTLASTLSPLEQPTQLDMVPILPRLAPPSIISNSIKELGLQQARMQSAVECIEYLEVFSPNCGICHAESGGTIRTGTKHRTIKDCRTGPHFRIFYDWNKPMVKGEVKWVYDTSSVGPWCYACALPQRALKERGVGHDMSQCPWSDTMMGVAWSVWHNEEMWEEMKKSVACKLPCGLKLASKKAWFSWLAGENEKRTAYNIHEIWLWYCRAYP